MNYQRSKTALRALLIGFIDLYQKVSAFGKKRCVFYPSCSEYAKQAIMRYGINKGIYLGVKRILRCHPWQKNHIDPVT